MRTLQERFDEKYIKIWQWQNFYFGKSGCWLWTASLNNEGYGKIRVKDKIKSAHRVSYELHIGKIPNGLCVLHDCDIPACVNPDHFFLGTVPDNNEDKVKKGRQAKGSKVHGAKLNEADIPEIRKDLKEGSLTQQEIAAKFGVSKVQISRIKLGKTWAHV